MIHTISNSDLEPKILTKQKLSQTFKSKNVHFWNLTFEANFKISR